MTSVTHMVKSFYWVLFIAVVAMTIMGIVFIHAASFTPHFSTDSFAFKQMVWMLLGLCFMFTIVAIGYRPFLNVSYLLYAASLILLIAVIFIGSERLGAQRWIQIGSFALQPSEFAKLGLIIALSHYLGSREQNLLQPKRFIMAFVITFIPLIFIIKQPDLGTSLIFLPILYAMLYLWGARLRYIFVSISLGILSLPVLWFMLRDYQRARLTTFINPNADPMGAGYTAIQAKIAVGSGGLWGKGLFCGTQNRLNFVPEHHTDFIFCVIAEEGGFMLAAGLILCFIALFWLSTRVIQRTTDPEAKLLAIGISAMLFFQVFINIGMTMGLCPITGLPLPLISYGGSSLLTYYIAFGFLISIYKERTIF